MFGLHRCSNVFLAAALLALPACGDGLGIGGTDDGAQDGGTPGGDGNDGGSSGGGGDSGDGDEGDGATDDGTEEPGDGSGDDSGDDGGVDEFDPCFDVSCGEGYCVVEDGEPKCECYGDYEALGLKCVQCEPVGTPYDVDIPMLEVTGTFKINGFAPPASQYDDANIYLRNRGTGDEVLLGNTHDETFAATIVPGAYDLYYELENGGMLVPANEKAKLRTVLLEDSGQLEVDIPAVALAGAITINGGPPPQEVYQNGYLYLRNRATKDAVRLGETRDGSFQVPVIPGDYEVFYVLKEGGDEVPANANAWVEQVKVPNTPEVGATVDVDIPAVILRGDFTINGSTPPDSQYDTGTISLRNDTGDEVVLGATRDASYRMAIVPGRYDVYYSVTQAGSTVPTNKEALLGEVDVPATFEVEVVRNMDVATVSVSGDFLVDDAPPPTATNDDGVVVLHDQETGDEVVLGNTHEGSYERIVVPGKYDIHYSQTTSNGGVPQNTNAKLVTVDLLAPTAQDVNIPTVQVTGTITVGGQPPPTTQYDDGRLYLRNAETGDSVLLGNTHEGSFSALVIPGTYDVHYALETGGTDVPVNNDAYVQTVDVEEGVPLQIDIEVIDLVGNFLVGGMPAPPTISDFGSVYLEHVATRDAVYLGGTNDGTYGQRLVTGRYLLFYRQENANGLVPTNTNAGLACLDIE